MTQVKLANEGGEEEPKPGRVGGLHRLAISQEGGPLIGGDQAPNCD